MGSVWDSRGEEEKKAGHPRDGREEEEEELRGVDWDGHRCDWVGVGWVGGERAR